MEPRQFKRKRPTLEDAHRFHKEGSHLTIPGVHYTSEQERISAVTRVGNELQQVAKQQFPRTTNLEHALLKGHLIVEYAITAYIRCCAHVVVDEKDLRFNFAQKLDIAYLMGFGANQPILIPTIELLNKARNQVAHKFSLDRRLVDELIRINSEEYKELKIANDRQRISWLRSICAFICAATAGRLDAAAFMTSREIHNSPVTDPHSN